MSVNKGGESIITAFILIIYFDLSLFNSKFLKKVILQTSGFTLIEIVIVLAILGLLCSIAIPQALRARMNANEVAAITAVRAMNSVCHAYYSDVNPHSYPDSLVALTFPDSNPAYIDSGIAGATDANSAKLGYYYEFTLGNSESFTIVAWPKNFGRTGARNFFVNQLGVITYSTNENEAPDETYPPVQ